MFKTNKILFLGLGGAGQRHLRIFRKLLLNKKFYAYRQKFKTPLLKSNFSVSTGSLSKKYSITILKSLNECIDLRPDLTIISLPTSLHAKFVCLFSELGSNIFVEKPGLVNLKEAKKIKKTILSNRVNFFVSFQRRFHPITIKLKKLISGKKVNKINSIRVTVSSYVPNWHKYENFLNLYACKKKLGGGVIKTECHEIDMICWLFGLPKSIKYNYDKRSNYKIDVEDSAELIFKYDHFSVQFSLYFMQKKQMRAIEIFSENKYIKCDYVKQSMMIENFKNDKKILNKMHINNDKLFTEQAKYYLRNYKNLTKKYLKTSLHLGKIFNILN